MNLTFAEGRIDDAALRLDCGSGTVGISGIGCFIIVGIVTVVGIWGNAGEMAVGLWIGTLVAAISEFELLSSLCDKSNIFLALAIPKSAPENSEYDVVPLDFLRRLVASEDDWGIDNFTVVLGLPAKLGGSDFKGLLLGDGADKKRERY